MKDLVVLVADAEMKEVLRALCQRCRDLGTRRFDFETRRFPKDRDGGTRKRAHERLRPDASRFRRALVVFDHHGCGREQDDRAIIQRRVEVRLAQNGWGGGRAKVVVIEPELEAWVWGDVKALGRCLGWDTNGRRLRDRLRAAGSWRQDDAKPHDPKKAMHWATWKAPVRRHRRISGVLFREIAQSARIDSCRDPAFQELVATLRGWFPLEDGS